MDTPSVELRPAFAWDCPQCDRELFARKVFPELSPDELARLRSEHGVEPWEAARFYVHPAIVKCPVCGGKFATEGVSSEVE